MAIIIEFVDHKSQVYATVGNYRKLKNGDILIEVSKLGNEEMEQCVALHELAEYFMITHDKIPISRIDKFDKNFEAKRKEGNYDEPGDSKKSPYYHHHQVATLIEKMLSFELEVDWHKYENKINKLEWKK